MLCPPSRHSVSPPEPDTDWRIPHEGPDFHHRRRPRRSALLPDKSPSRSPITIHPLNEHLSTPKPSDVDQLATDLVGRLGKFEGIDCAAMIALGPGDFACFLAMTGRPLPRLEVGRPLPRSQARYLRHRGRLGAWIERWIPRPMDISYGEQLAIDGLTAAAYIPVRNGTSVPGLLVAGTSEPEGGSMLERRLSTLAEFGAVVSALTGGALSEQRRTNAIRSQIVSVIRRRAFHPVFQPIVRLDSGEIVSVEGLTRFSDGTPPQRRFAEAEWIGLGVELEVATLEATFAAGRQLPSGLRLNVNVSPEMVLDPARLRGLLARYPGDVTLELTEQQRIDDYPSLRTAVQALPAGIRLAIDDAGAGFASLRHVIELRPHEVKLDRAIVADVDRDPIRQAVVAGMCHFASAAECALVAEGIESAAQRDKLLAFGVRFGQGHFFGGPMLAREIRQLHGVVPSVCG